MTSLPTGTVSFLFTDIEGSTRLAQQHREIWESLHSRHDAILRAAINAQGGYVFKITGDSYCAAFHTVGNAVRAAIKAQADLHAEDWGGTPLRVRMGIHAGQAEIQADGDYHGYLTLSRAQRLMSVGHGGQVLLSAPAQELMRDEIPKGVSLLDLGEQWLRDAIGPEHVYQLNTPGLRVDFPPLRTLHAAHHNLPTQMTRFIGRERELAQVREAIRQHCLVTLTGPGGSGKTRLALQVAADLLDEFPDGVWLVELAPLQTPEAIVPAIASTLDLPFYEGGDPRQQLLHHLRERTTLLILDNFEHLLSGANLVCEILAAAPRARILSTSRTRLNVQREQLYLLGGMDFPDPEAPTETREYSGVSLFVQGARRIFPDFQLLPPSLNSVARICALVEGMPLGILLASAWAGMLAPHEIAAEIEKSADFLAAEERDLPERQRSLRAVFDHTWRLLTAREQEAFKGLSVFRGGFTQEAAQQITGASLHELKGLVDKWLLHRDPSGRYGIHELLRQYAEARLLADVGANEVRERHARYFLQLAERAEPELRGPMQGEWSDALQRDYGNLRAALAWSLQHEDASIVMRLVAALADFWYYNGPVFEGEQWFAQALARTETVPLSIRARALVGGGMLAFAHGYDEQGEHWVRTALGIGRQLQDKSIAAWSLELLSMYSTSDPQKYQEGIDAAKEALLLYQELGNQQGLALVYNSLGELMRLSREYEPARSYYEKSLEISSQIGNRTREAVAVGNLAYCAMHRGDLRQAEEHALDALALSNRLNLRHHGAWAVSLLAGIAAAQGNAIRAATLLGASEAVFATTSGAQQPADVDENKRFVAMMKEQLPQHDFDAAWSNGKRMTYEQAVALALGSTSPASAPSSTNTLKT